MTLGLSSHRVKGNKLTAWSASEVPRVARRRVYRTRKITRWFAVQKNPRHAPLLTRLNNDNRHSVYPKQTDGSTPNLFCDSIVLCFCCIIAFVLCFWWFYVSCVSWHQKICARQQTRMWTSASFPRTSQSQQKRRSSSSTNERAMPRCNQYEAIICLVSFLLLFIYYVCIFLSDELLIKIHRSKKWLKPVPLLSDVCPSVEFVIIITILFWSKFGRRYETVRFLGICLMTWVENRQVSADVLIAMDVVRLNFLVGSLAKT